MAPSILHRILELYIYIYIYTMISYPTLGAEALEVVERSEGHPAGLELADYVLQGRRRRRLHHDDHT